MSDETLDDRDQPSWRGGGNFRLQKTIRRQHGLAGIFFHGPRAQVEATFVLEALRGAVRRTDEHSQASGGETSNR